MILFVALSFDSFSQNRGDVGKHWERRVLRQVREVTKFELHNSTQIAIGAFDVVAVQSA